MLNITFLLDKTNNWIEKYVNNFIFNNKNKLNFDIKFNHTEVKKKDIVFILGYTRVLDKSFLNANKLNLVVHESDLPYGKGFSPIQWQILKGKHEIVFTLFEAVENLDSGDIFLQKKVLFTGYELFDKIREIQGVNTFELIQEFLDMYPKVDRRPQQGNEVIFPRRRYEDDKLDIDKTIKEQFNHLRIANNDEYPLWFEIDGHRYIVKIYEDDK